MEAAISLTLSFVPTRAARPPFLCEMLDVISLKSPVAALLCIRSRSPVGLLVNRGLRSERCGLSKGAIGKPASVARPLGHHASSKFYALPRSRFRAASLRRRDINSRAPYPRAKLKKITSRSATSSNIKTNPKVLRRSSLSARSNLPRLELREASDALHKGGLPRGNRKHVRFDDSIAIRD
jgi:hypothetical protein